MVFMLSTILLITTVNYASTIGSFLTIVIESLRILFLRDSLEDQPKGLSYIVHYRNPRVQTANEYFACRETSVMNYERSLRFPTVFKVQSVLKQELTKSEYSPREFSFGKHRGNVSYLHSYVILHLRRLYAQFTRREESRSVC